MMHGQKNIKSTVMSKRTMKQIMLIYNTKHILSPHMTYDFHTHKTINHPTGPEIRADLNNPTINRILPPVIPTHYPHDIQHALNKPLLHTIRNTHITLILPNL